MSNFLAFTYDRPTEQAAPLWTAGTPRDTPSVIYWSPSIGCTDEQQAEGHSLTAAPGIPWKDINIAEIRVESRKAYEILNRIVPAGQSFFVRINPPDVISRDPAAQDTVVLGGKKRGLTIFTHGEESEFTLAASVAKGSRYKENTLIVSGDDPNLIAETDIAFFCHRASSHLGHLRLAIDEGCKIVSTDAGAAEEYLSRFAGPGRWHIGHSFERKEYLNMIRDVAGDSNDIFQTSAVDLTPYIKAWGNV